MMVWRCTKCGKTVKVRGPARFPITHCGTKHQWPEGVQGPLPPHLIQRAANFARDGIKHVLNRSATVDDATREWRRQQCLSCTQYFNPELETCTHQQCGCGMKKQRGIIDALGWASKRCPIGRWDDPPAPRVLSVYRTTGNQVSIGLGVNANLTAASLIAAGIMARPLAVESLAKLAEALSTEDQPELVVIEGSWADPDELVAIARENYRVRFIVRCHSQIAFLQIEPDTIGRFKDVATHSTREPNIRMAGNSRRFTDWASEAWGVDVLYLPNLYPVSDFTAREPFVAKNAPLQFASFGKMRLQKHHSVAVAAAAIVGKRLKRPVAFYVNGDKDTLGSASILRACQNIADSAGIKLKEFAWQTAGEFRSLICHADLCFQLSASETFNLVTADAIAAGVPSVVGEAIDWVPRAWRAPIDDPLSAAEVAMRLLADPTAGSRGQEALRQYSEAAIEQWRKVANSR